VTEDEWLGCTDPQKMLEALRASGTASGRKLRLFTCACCRLIWAFPNDDRSRQAVEVAEAYADGLASGDKILVAYSDMNACLRPLGRRYTHHPPAEVMDAAFIAFLRSTSTSGAYYGGRWEYRDHDAYRCAADAAERVATVAAWAGRPLESIHRHEATLLRDLFIPPACRTRPSIASAVRAWQGGTVLRLAQAVYEDRDLPAGTFRPDRVAVLADALEEAGVTDDAILAHLRGPAAHVRGCHVVDLLLGRS
jgi:hypothetical protein